jgi:hypothetical protein
VAPAFKELLSDPDIDREDSEKCVYVPDLVIWAKFTPLIIFNRGLHSSPPPKIAELI